MKKQKKLGTAGLADFFRQFSVLVSSGLPVAGVPEDPYLYDDIPGPVCLSSDPSDAGTTP